MSYVSITELFPSSFVSEATHKKSLGEEFQLCEHGNMVFHWSDFGKTCDMVKEMLEKHVEASDDFKRREEALRRLALITVWVKSEKSATQTSMFDLYERYILNQTRLSMGVDPFGPIEISFISSTGPFKKLALVECFNMLTYRDFVMVYLLKGKLPRRDFRLRLKSKILMEYGPQFKETYLINLEQLTSQGLLLSMGSDFYLNTVAKNQEIQLLIDSGVLAQGLTKNFEDLKKHISQYAFNLLYSAKKEDAIRFKISDLSVQSSFDFLKNKKVFLFIPFEKIEGQKRVVLDIENFMSYSKDLVSKHFKNYLAKTA